MSKKKGKNSNYKAEGIFEAKNAATQTINQDKLKDMIIWAVTGVIILGILIAVIVSAIPKIYYVEMDFGEYGKIVIEMNQAILCNIKYMLKSKIFILYKKINNLIH